MDLIRRENPIQTGPIPKCNAWKCVVHTDINFRLQLQIQAQGGTRIPNIWGSQALLPTRLPTYLGTLVFTWVVK